MCVCAVSDGVAESVYGGKRCVRRQMLVYGHASPIAMMSLFQIVFFRYTDPFHIFMIYICSYRVLYIYVCVCV